jgi:hypothetical protein
MTVAMKSGNHGEKSSSKADVNPAADDFELPADFQMPTVEEIEHDLALSKLGWTSLLNTAADESTQTVSWLLMSTQEVGGLSSSWLLSSLSLQSARLEPRRMPRRIEESQLTWNRARAVCKQATRVSS